MINGHTVYSVKDYRGSAGRALGALKRQKLFETKTGASSVLLMPIQRVSIGMKETGTRRYDREPATLPRSQELLLGSVLQWTDSHPTCDPLQLPVVQTCSIRQQRSAWVLMSCLCFEDSRRSVVGYRALADRSLFRLLIIALATPYTADHGAHPL
jgi:hypothetical protein